MLKGRRAILLLRVVIGAGPCRKSRGSREKSREGPHRSTTLVERRGHPARALAIVLSLRHTSLSLREIAERCGGSDYAAATSFVCGVSRFFVKLFGDLGNDYRVLGEGVPVHHRYAIPLEIHPLRHMEMA